MGVPGSNPGGRKTMAEERLADPCRGLRETAGECWQDYITTPKAPGQPGDPGLIVQAAYGRSLRTVLPILSSAF